MKERIKLTIEFSISGEAIEKDVLREEILKFQRIIEGNKGLKVSRYSVLDVKVAWRHINIVRKFKRKLT